MGTSETETTSTFSTFSTSSTFSTTKMLIFLLVPLLCLLCPSEAYEGTIQCRGKEGTRNVTETWDCGRSGITCSYDEEDCSGCGENGRSISGRSTYLYSGEPQTAVGKELDCRYKCTGITNGVTSKKIRCQCLKKLSKI